MQGQETIKMDLWNYKMIQTMFLIKKFSFKCLWYEIVSFWRKYLAYHMYKPIPIEEIFKKT